MMFATYQLHVAISDLGLCLITAWMLLQIILLVVVIFKELFS